MAGFNNASCPARSPSITATGFPRSRRRDASSRATALFPEPIPPMMPMTGMSRCADTGSLALDDLADTTGIVACGETIPCEQEARVYWRSGAVRSLRTYRERQRGMLVGQLHPDRNHDGCQESAPGSLGFPAFGALWPRRPNGCVALRAYREPDSRYGPRSRYGELP